jgi:indole-3-glycerol phosphate synthase
MSVLDEILASTATRVEASKAKVTEDALEQRVASAEPPRGFRRALEGDAVALIAEIKRRSPSKGDLALDLDPRKMAASFRDGGAAALSVLTEPDHFAGSLDDLAAAREAGLPVLRKDFLVDPWQIVESRAEGADCVLLIVRVVGERLGELSTLARSLGMDVLVEVYDEDDVRLALGTGADLVGINHRDLTTFEVDTGRTERLAPLLPDHVLTVALSGVSNRDEIERMAAAGARAVLVGESLVTSPDPADAVRSLRGA